MPRGISLVLPITALLFTIVLTSMAPLFAEEIDWGRIKSTTITLFYPGRSSWEFLLSDDHRLGGRKITQGKRDCAHCHLSKMGELDLIADEIATGTARMKRTQLPFENEPIPGKKGVLLAGVKAAYDKEYIYIRIEWASQGTGWKSTTEGVPPDRVSLQVNKKLPSFEKNGCFITCHKDQLTMPESPSKEEVRKHPYYKKIGRDDVHLYAFYTRNGGWNGLKGEKELEELLNENGLVDLWSVELKGEDSSARDGWIFEDRRWEDGIDVEGSGRWSDGIYSVVMKRRLATGDKKDVQIREGEPVSIGIAIHDDRVTKRKHYVSFPISVGIGTKGDIRAQKVPE